MAEGLTPAARALLHVLSVLNNRDDNWLNTDDDNGIPEEILKSALGQVDLPDYPISEAAYLDAREELIKSSLITCTHNPDSDTINILEIIQEVVQEKMTIQRLRDAINAAVVLLSVVWPFTSSYNLNERDRMPKIEKYFPYLKYFDIIIKEKTAKSLQLDIRICALLNEASWFYILQPSGYGLEHGERFGQLSQAILESHGDDNVNQRLLTKLLGNSHRFQGLIASYKGDPTSAIDHCKEWLGILVNRIENHAEEEDVEALPIAYTELGIAKVKAENIVEALKLWTMACGMLKPKFEGELVYPLPWIYLALIHAYSDRDGDGDAADRLLAPILQAHSAKLQLQVGSEDTSTITMETGLVMAAMGNIRWVQGRREEALTCYGIAAYVFNITCGADSFHYSMVRHQIAVCDLQVEHNDRGRAISNLFCNFMFYQEHIPWYKPQAARTRWTLSKALSARGGGASKEQATSSLQESATWSMWKLGRALLGMGGEGSKEQTTKDLWAPRAAREHMQKAMELRKEIVPDDDRAEIDLDDEDWDDLVFFFGR